MQDGPYPDVPPDFGNWLAGLIDGEGCFLIVTRPPRGAAIHTYYAMHFRLILRSDDTAVLEECHARTGLGRLYTRRHKGHDGHDRKPQTRWEVFTRSETRRLVELLNEFPLRSKKKRDFEVWAEAVRLWTTSVQPYRGGNRSRGMNGTFRSVNADVWDQMAALKLRLSDVREFREHDESVVLVREPLEDNPVAAGGDEVMTLW